MSYIDDVKEQLSLKPPRGKIAQIAGVAGAPLFQYPDYFSGPFGMTTVTEQDALNFCKYMLSLYESKEPHSGEFVRFGNGALVRVAHVWRICADEVVTTPCNEHNHFARTIQTCVNGSMHLGEGFTSMSGSLDSGAKFETFSLTNELRLGSAWIWHNNFSGASRAVPGMISFRVWKSTAIPRDYLPCGDCGCFWTSHSVGNSSGWWCAKHNQKCTQVYDH